MDNHAIAKMLSRYFATFGRKPDNEIIAAYALTLRDLSDEQLAAAFAAAMRKPTDHPLSAGQLFALGASGGRDAEALAEAAFALLDETMGSGEYPLDYEDKRINAAVRELGGLQTLSNQPLDQFRTWTRKAFVAAYRRLLEHPPSEDACRPLRGTLAADHRLSDGRTLGEVGALRIGRDEAGRAVKSLPSSVAKPVAISHDFGLQLNVVGSQS